MSEDNNEERRANTRINSALERFFFFVMSVGVSVVAGVQYQQYKDNADIRLLLIQHDNRISAIENEISIIRGQMIGWDVLKRIELYMASMAPEQANSALIKAIRAESQSRESKQ